VPFVVIQVIMVGMVIAFPGLVTGNLERSKIDPSKVQIIIPPESEQTPDEAAPPDFGTPGDAEPATERKPGESATESREGDDLEKLFKK